MQRGYVAAGERRGNLGCVFADLVDRGRLVPEPTQERSHRESAGCASPAAVEDAVVVIGIDAECERIGAEDAARERVADNECVTVRKSALGPVQFTT